MRPSLQQIASQAGVSKMTVSLALRASTQIPPVTRDRICKIATEIGYRPDPTFSLLMAHIRSRAPAKYQATLAVAGFSPRDIPSGTQQSYLAGIEQQAARRGYSVDFVQLTEPGLTPEKVFKMLQTRGIKGVILWAAGSPFLPPAYRAVYENFPCVVVGIKPRMPELHFVTGDAYAFARMAFGQALKAGYHRPGVLFNITYDQRQERRHLASFLAEQLVLPPDDRVPLLEVQTTRELAARFTEWHARHRPDCLISGFDGAAAVVRAAGLRIPEDLGYIALERGGSPSGTAGVDPNSREIGAAAVDLLIALQHGSEIGVPAIQRSVVVEGTWVPGATLPILHEKHPDDDVPPSWQRAYPLLGRPGSGRASPLNLRRAANRRLTTFCGYTSPLLYLEPGRQKIHGVPFQLVSEEQAGEAVIAINSLRRKSPGEPAAGKVTVPMRRRAAAVYFLHTCLYVQSSRPVARYELVYEDKSRAAVDVAPLGREAADGRSQASSAVTPCVQDWWPSHPHLDSEHVRHLVVASPDEPDLYQRYLYTFEWINPHPERQIRALQITALPGCETTLIVLAITTVEPAPIA